MPRARLALALSALTLSALAVPAALTGCDEPATVNKPSVLSAEAVCRRVEGVYKLDQVTVLVADLDGIADLNDPLATVVATALPMMVEPSETPPTDPETGEELGCDGAEGQCVARYTWRHADDSEQIFCGEDGDLLEVLFEIDDVAGFWVRRAIPTRPL